METLTKLNVDFDEDTISTSTHSSITKHPEYNHKIVQNYRLVWLDSDIDEVNNTDTIYIMKKFREIVNVVDRFTNIDDCIPFINNINAENIFMICSEELGETIVPLTHDMAKINCVYIFCKHITRHEQWRKEWSKVKGIYMDITSICEALKQTADECDHNLVSISFIQSNDGNSKENLDILDNSFTHMHIMKEILLKIKFEQSHINEFLTYCREKFFDNVTELENIDMIEKEYHQHQPIWWYTYNCFLKSMLHQALRLMDIDLIIKMGFFIRDLNNHISAVHDEQYARQNSSDSFTVYRGQGLSQINFDQMKNVLGGLLSFNNFIWTSKKFDTSLGFANKTMVTSNSIGVFFVMKIDPSISGTPFVNTRNISYSRRGEEEEEILFSMHSVFRIIEVKRIDENDRLWQVNLTLTSNNDPQLHALTERMRENNYLHLKGWNRFGISLIKLGQSNKAEQLYDILLQETNDADEKAGLFQMLGTTKQEQGKYTQAIKFNEKALDFYQKFFHVDHSDLVISYTNIGLMYNKVGDYEKALSYYEKALEIKQKTLPVKHSSLATSYNNIGLVYDNMRQYSKALSYYQKTLEIREQTLYKNRLHLATSYNNIGLVYNNMGKYSEALSYYEKTLEIKQKNLRANHPNLATSYNNIGLVYDNMRQYSKALSYYEKTLEIDQKTLPVNHPHFATLYNSIGLVYYKMTDYLKALSYYEKALDIYEKTLLENHPDLATSYVYHSSVYDKMGDYEKALSYCKKAFEIRAHTLPSHHSHIAIAYDSVTRCIIRWEGTRNHCHIMKKHLKSIKKRFRQIMLDSNMYKTT